MSVDLTPYAHYKCNDNAGNTVVTDDGTGANNGIAEQNTSEISITGKINEALDFNGISDSINVNGLQSDIETDSTGSFSFWINPDDFDNVVQYVFEIGDLSDTQDYLFIRTLESGNKLAISINANDTHQWNITSATPLSASNWYHIVVVQNGTSPKLYINATLDIGIIFGQNGNGESTWFGDFIASNVDFASIGQSKRGDGGSANPKWFDGKIDDFRYYQNKALTEEEVGLLYNNGNGTESQIINVGFPHSQGFIIS